MILGDTCTRSCSFCRVNKKFTGKLGLEKEEPFKVAQKVKDLKLRYVVITSVTRDDLDDGGSGVFAETIGLIRNLNHGVIIEILIPDFRSKLSSLNTVLDSGPNVVGHNLETVKRLYPRVRPQAGYKASLGLLALIKKAKPKIITKSSIMLGMGESRQELVQAMKDLHAAGCDILTLGQYLAPSREHYPVKKYVTPQEFESLKEEARLIGFRSILSGPLVRSSYQAQKLYDQFICA